jgi:hypothetical protein
MNCSEGLLFSPDIFVEKTQNVVETRGVIL